MSTEHGVTAPRGDSQSAPAGSSTDTEFEALLLDLRETRGFDFTGYKRPSLQRRVAVRMADVGIEDVAEYRDHLQVHPQEFEHLFNTVLINVTAFFRDPERWAYLADELLPQIIEAAGDGPIRVWSAGCASGEEAYTVAMLLAEEIGVQQLATRVKIYATDVDEEALREARAATYRRDQVEDVPEPLRERYFEPVGDRFLLRDEIRRAVIFGRHDLVSDAPISNLHLLVCRNVLMYLNAETQFHILKNAHFALRDDGFLFLGRAEMLVTRSDLFEPFELQHRAFRRVPNGPVSRRPRALGGGADRQPVGARLGDAAVTASPVAQIVVDLEGDVELVNERARALFGLAMDDVGRPFLDLEQVQRVADLRDALQEVREQFRPARIRNVTLRVGEDRAGQDRARHLDIVLAPLFGGPGELLGVLVSVHDLTEVMVVRSQLQEAADELVTAQEELRSSNEELETTNEELQSTIEELETTNEALQSSNEELETTNEELQSSNEELETMNEELQSSNAEQEEINRDLLVRTDEVGHVNAYYRSILQSLKLGVVVVGPDFDVQVWNSGAFELWGLREEEVERRSLLALDVGLPVAELADPVRRCFADGEPASRTVAAVNRRGRSFDCVVELAPLDDRDGRRVGVVVLMHGPGDDEPQTP